MFLSVNDVEILVTFTNGPDTVDTFLNVKLDDSEVGFPKAPIIASAERLTKLTGARVALTVCTRLIVAFFYIIACDKMSACN